MPRRRRSKVQRVLNLIRHIVAFLFSHVGLCALVVGYSLLGAFTFRAIERPHEREIQYRVVSSRHSAVNRMWDVTYELNILYEDHWSHKVFNQVLDFRRTVTTAVKQGYDGKDKEENPQWSFSGAFLYALTVITTIGYGHIAPRTYMGKALTIIYAILGIPLMLLFLTNVGDILAKTFKFIYGRMLRLKIHLILKYRRKRAAGVKRQNSLQGVRAKYSGRSFHSMRSGQHRHAGLMTEMDLVNSTGDRFRPDSDPEQQTFELAPVEEELLRIDTGRLLNMAEIDRLSARESIEQRISNVTVPVSASMLVMTLYLVGGAVLFCVWEDWDFLDALYFCYISLTTIGFGDLVPGASIMDGNGGHSSEKLVICSLYLLFGMALIAMCFNLAQEEVVNKLMRLAEKLGMLKTDDY